MIDRRDLLKALGLMPLAAASGEALADEEQWNILILSMDEHNPRFMSHLGHVEAYTPTLDQLAQDGCSLTRCYTTAPVCAPTRQSFLTGLYPQEHGQLTNAHIFHQDNDTLAAFFRDLGYDTACFGKLHTQADEEVYDFGFDTFLNSNRPTEMTALRKAYRSGTERYYEDPDEKPHWDSMPVSKLSAKVRPDPAFNNDWILTRGALEFLQEEHTRPFFLYLSLRFPHYPFDLPEDHYYLYDHATVTLPETMGNSALGSKMATKSHNQYAWSTFTETQHRLLYAKYLASIHFADSLFAEVLAELEAQGLREKTIIVYLSDHGDMALDKGCWLKSTFHDAAVRKPMIVCMPGVLDGGGTLEAPFSEVDILPTVAGLAGLGHLLPDISGQDRSMELLLSANGVREERWLSDFQVVPRTHALSVSHLRADAPDAWATFAVSDRLGLIRYSPINGDYQYEAYDLFNDPDETVDISDDPAYATDLAELEACMDTHYANLRAPAFPITKTG